QQGITGVELQNRLPRARVVYASATGASDINNLAYAVRLGLWGEGTAFPDRTAFITRIREGGIAAMELVARELKAMGVYTARALSYAGVEYDILEHQLSVEQIADFDAYADAWSVVHQNMEEALSAAGVIDQVDGRTLNGQALSAARSRFESSKQRFFGQLLLSMKLPTLLPAIARALEAEQSVVVQLVSTSEALLDRRLAELDPADRAELSVDLSPKELLPDYLNSAFPTRAMESYWDDEGYERSRPMADGGFDRIAGRFPPSHIGIIWSTAALGCHPVDVLRRVLDVAGLAMDAVLGVDRLAGAADIPAQRIAGRTGPVDLGRGADRLPAKLTVKTCALRAGLDKRRALGGRSVAAIPGERTARGASIGAARRATRRGQALVARQAGPTAAAIGHMRLERAEP
ncbi:hypothetical protein E4T56_gene3873, partial [Termitomyces sp. T112]